MLPTIVTVNPFMAKRRRRTAHAKRTRNRLRYSAHHHSKHRAHRRPRHRQRLHNPFSVRSFTAQLMPAVIGAGGAVLTDVAMAYLPTGMLPAALQSGWGNILTRAAVAVGVGAVVGLAVNKDIGKAVAAGGLLVVAYSGLKTALAPTLGTSIKGLSGLADFGDYVPYGQQGNAMVGGMGAYMQPRLGAYMQPRRLGAYMNPASFVSASHSPVRAKQMASFRGFGAYGSEYQGAEGSLM